jgi:hypothetical protein
MSEAKFQRKTDARKQPMGDDDKELTEDEINRLFSADFLYDSEPTECEPDATTRATLNALDELDAFDRFERILADEPAFVSTSVSWRPAFTIPTSANPKIPLEATADPSKIETTVGEPEFFDRVSLRSTKRKRGRYSPNCFGSQFLHDPDSTDCRPCRFSEGCKKAIVDEMPLLEAERNRRQAHFRKTGRDKRPPADPKEIEFKRNLLRGHLLAKYRKAQRKRRVKDKNYRQKRRANPDTATLIKKEFRKRLSVLREAISQAGNNKYLQQLGGREEMIMAVWEAEKDAQLAHGPTASAARVAKAYNEMIGEDVLSRDQASTYQGHFRKLERLPRVWKRFVKSPDDKIA